MTSPESFQRAPQTWTTCDEATQICTDAFMYEKRLLINKELYQNSIQEKINSIRYQILSNFNHNFDSKLIKTENKFQLLYLEILKGAICNFSIKSLINKCNFYRLFVNGLSSHLEINQTPVFSVALNSHYSAPEGIRSGSLHACSRASFRL